MKAKLKEITEKLTGGGIRGKVLQLIILSLLILSVAFILMSVVHSHMLSNLVANSSEKQEKAISETADGIMDEVVTQNLDRSNMLEVRIADEMFDSTRDSLIYLKDETEEMFAHPGNYGYKSYSPPDPADDGKWTAKVIYADGTDPGNGAVRAKLGLLANMSDEMIDLCTSYGLANVYVGLPEGAHFSISDSSSSWYEDGKIKSYDPRTRGWYQKAEEEGKLVFTDGEWDANTGAYCIECAVPVYDQNHKLQAVIGADMYLDDMQKTMRQAAVEGEYYLILNRSGAAVLAPQEDTFPLSKKDRGGDIRKSKNKKLAKIAAEALKGRNVNIQLAELEGDMYYVTASPIETTGWVLISAYSQETMGQASVLLQKKLEDIQKESSRIYQNEIAVYRVSSLLVILLIMALILWTASIRGKRIVDPLNSITERVSQLEESNPEFTMEDEYRTGDEVEELAESFASLSHKTMEYMDQVVRVTAEKERIGAELSLANDIQSAMLPHIFPAFPHRSDFDIYASMDPAKEVGGDFYDYFFIDDEHLGVLIADVSGKGVPAALFMMASKIILQSVASMGYSPKEILEKTNDSLCMNNEAEMFVTVWMGILNTTTGKMTASNAGHEYPVIKKPGGQFELVQDEHSFVLGDMEGLKYKEYEMQMDKGTKLFLYTDGVPEATNADKELFGTKRMVEALNRHADGSPYELLTSVRAAVDDFVQDAEQFDDLTMLCLEYFGSDDE